MNDNELKRHLRQNIEWFLNSGIMDPGDGSWGVAERIVLTKGNEAEEQIFKNFPLYTKHNGYAILEHRRPDCNFETALMFLLASNVFNDKSYFKVADNILNYLYFRSGLRNIGGNHTGYSPEAWNWATDRWGKVLLFFDDNAWNCIIPLVISKIAPELDNKYGLKKSALILGNEIHKAFSTIWANEKELIDGPWYGDLRSPHWGALAVLAISFTYSEKGGKEYEKAVNDYQNYLLAEIKNFTASELAYIMIGFSAAAAFGIPGANTPCAAAAETLIAKANRETGLIPSEWNKEAPVGTNLVDLIYTMNWALLGFQMTASLINERKYSEMSRKILDLVVGIQDNSEEKHLNGCWRGMYDLEKNEWGGGNRYEGGADSIYSGWTNAPISIVIAFELLKQSLINIK